MPNPRIVSHLTNNARPFCNDYEMRVLVAYANKTGFTESMAEFVGEKFVARELLRGSAVTLISGV